MMWLLLYGPYVVTLVLINVQLEMLAYERFGHRWFFVFVQLGYTFLLALAAMIPAFGIALSI